MSKVRPDIIDSQLDIASSEPVIAVQIDLGTETLYYATRELTLDGNTYLDSISSVGRIENKLNPLAGGFGTISDFTLEIMNVRLSTDTISDRLFKSDVLGTLNAKIYLIYDTPSVYSINQAMQLYDGGIMKVEWGLNKAKLYMVNALMYKYINLPQTIITDEEYEDATDDVMGAPIPILYGNFRPSYATESNDYRTFEFTTGGGVSTPALLIQKSLNQYAFADHPCHFFSDPSYHPISNNSDVAWNVFPCEQSSLVQLEPNNKQLISYTDIFNGGSRNRTFN